MKRAYTLSREARTRIVEKVAEILSHCGEVLFAYLHGSFVREQVFHDLDVAIFLDPEKTGDRSFVEVELEQRVEEALASPRVPVDVRVLNHAPLSFRYQVIKNGIPIYVRDDARRTFFEEITLLQYSDFLPFYRRYLAGVLGIEHLVR